MPEMTEMLKCTALDDSHMPPLLEGMNMDALVEFFISLTDSRNHGWNPEEDYRKLSSLMSTQLRPRYASTKRKVLMYSRPERHNGTP